MINLSCDCADRHPTHHYSHSTLFFTTICAYFPHIWTTYPQSHRNHLKTTSWMHVTKDCIKTGGERADPLQGCLKNYLNMDNLAIYTCCVNCVHLSFHCSPSLLILVCLPLQIIAFSLPTLKAISFRNCPELFCPFWWWSKTAEAFGELQFVIQVQSQMQLRDIGFARLTDWGLGHEDPARVESWKWSLWSLEDMPSSRSYPEAMSTTIYMMHKTFTSIFSKNVPSVSHNILPLRRGGGWEIFGTPFQKNFDASAWQRHKKYNVSVKLDFLKCLWRPRKHIHKETSMTKWVTR